ncbi:hypothetical protein ACIP4Q_23635 [Streptomyces massasporeus]
MDTHDVLLPPTWEEFRQGVHPRFTVLPIRSFAYRIQYVPTLIPPEDRDDVFNIVNSAVVSALQTEPLTDLTALRVSGSTMGDVRQEAESEDQYFTIHYGHPTFDFAVQMGPTTFVIAKQRTNMENLLHTVRLFALIASRLIPAPEAKGSQSFNNVGISEKIHKVSFTFNYEVSLGEQLSTNEDINNLKLLDRLARIPPSEKSATSPLVALQPDAITRGDISVFMSKTIKHRPRTILVSYEGPWNVTQKDVDLEFSYRMGGPTSPMQEWDVRDFRTPFEDFYRQLILKRLFVDLFSDAALIGRA